MTDKDLQFLKDLGRKMNAQNNRMTQFPMFQIRQKKKLYVGYEMDWEEKERNDEDTVPWCENCAEIYESGGVTPYDCDECDIDCFHYYKWVDKIVDDCGNFFTEEAAQQHIDANHYHYHEPYIFGIGSWRNYELQNLLEILSRLGSEDDKAKGCYSYK